MMYIKPIKTQLFYPAPQENTIPKQTIMNLSLLKTVLFTLIGSSAAWAPKGHDYHPPFPTDSA
jgi:hypothetical protein